MSGYSITEPTLAQKPGAVRNRGIDPRTEHRKPFAAGQVERHSVGA